MLAAGMLLLLGPFSKQLGSKKECVCVCVRTHVCMHVSNHECIQYVHDASIKVKSILEIMRFIRHFQPKFRVEFLYLLLFYVCIFSLSVIGKISAPNYINIFIICFMLVYVSHKIVMPILILTINRLSKI